MSVYASLIMAEPLTSIERRLLAVEQSNAPDGHAISGPAQRPPFWTCSCGHRWSDGQHPDETFAPAGPSGPEQPSLYPYD